VGLGQFDETYPYTFAAHVQSTDGVASVLISGTESGPRRIDAITATNTDTIVHVIQLRQVFGTTTRLIGSATIPIGAGTGGLASLDVLAACQPSTNPSLCLLPGDSLSVVLEVALTATKVIDIVTRGGTL